MDEANQFATENPDRVREVITEKLELDPELVEQTNLAVFAPGLDEESVKTYAEAAVKYGMIGEEPNFDDIFVRPES
ncbi:hypothetical protein [Georgenia sp. SUBG003]